MNVHHRWANVLRCFGRLAVAVIAIQQATTMPGCWAEEDRLVAHLYFADARNPFLVAEPRTVINLGDPTALGRWIVAELIDGSNEGNLSTIPAGTQLRSFFVLVDGTAVVDFTSLFRENHPGGCRLEQLTLFSVVNSLVLNVPEINRVKILIDGVETRTLAGHLPIEFPLTADMLLTR